MEQSHSISIDEEYRRFYDHFSVNENVHIVFSGRYGIGKTFFLKKFFEQEEISKNYDPIFLYPVNYAVSSNEDIFEIIKVDIIKELFLKKYVKLEEDLKYYKTQAFVKYAVKRPVHLLSNLSALFSKISVEAELISKGGKGYLKLLKDFEKFENELNEELVTDSKKLENFADSYIQNSTGVLEDNIITETIKGAIKRNKKESILVIDDLDRLDPGHIFRILNVFSAHNNNDTHENKFGFSKIIIVCDIDNIQRIFTHIYGSNTDFDGYFDKFYSICPYIFNNSEAVHFYLKNKLGVNLPDAELSLLVFLLIELEKDKKVNLRKIFKTNLYHESQEKEILNYTTNTLIQAPHIVSNRVLITNNDIMLIKVFKILQLIVGTYDKIEQLFEEYSKLQRHINGNTSGDFIRAIAIPKRLMDYYRENKINPLVMSSAEDDFPHGTLFEHFHYVITLKWNYNTRYMGNGRLFENSEVVLLNKNRQAYTIPSLAFVQIMPILKSFYLLCKEKKMLED